MAMMRLVARGPVALEQAFGASLQSVRAYSNGGLKGFAEHEKAAEDMYFTKEDQRNFQKLMGKIKKQSDEKDVHAAAGTRAAEVSALKPILDKYKVAADDVDKILAWKHTHY